MVSTTHFRCLLSGGCIALLWVVVIVQFVHLRQLMAPSLAEETVGVESQTPTNTIWKEIPQDDRPLRRWRERAYSGVRLSGSGDYPGSENSQKDAYTQRNMDTVADARYYEVVSEILRYNGSYQQSRHDYLLTVNILSRIRPCNALIFGTGRDSSWYIRANTGGRTVFIENNPNWIRIAYTFPFMNESEVYEYKYKTQVNATYNWLTEAVRSEKELHSRLYMDGLPEGVLNEAWDVILVDAPVGLREFDPGRFQPIYMLEHFAKIPHNRKSRDRGFMHVFVHDCERKVERFALQFFGWNPPIRKGVKLIHTYDSQSWLCYFHVETPLNG